MIIVLHCYRKALGSSVSANKELRGKSYIHSQVNVVGSRRIGDFKCTYDENTHVDWSWPKVNASTENTATAEETKFDKRVPITEVDYSPVEKQDRAKVKSAVKRNRSRAMLGLNKNLQMLRSTEFN